MEKMNRFPRIFYILLIVLAVSGFSGSAFAQSTQQPLEKRILDCAYELDFECVDILMNQVDPVLVSSMDHATIWDLLRFYTTNFFLHDIVHDTLEPEHAEQIRNSFEKFLYLFSGALSQDILLGGYGESFRSNFLVPDLILPYLDEDSSKDIAVNGFFKNWKDMQPSFLVVPSTLSIPEAKEWRDKPRRDGSMAAMDGWMITDELYNLIMTRTIEQASPYLTCDDRVAFGKALLENPRTPEVVEMAIEILNIPESALTDECDRYRTMSYIAGETLNLLAFLILDRKLSNWVYIQQSYQPLTSPLSEDEKIRYWLKLLDYMAPYLDPTDSYSSSFEGAPRALLQANADRFYLDTFFSKLPDEKKRCISPDLMNELHKHGGLDIFDSLGQQITGVATSEEEDRCEERAHPPRIVHKQENTQRPAQGAVQNAGMLEFQCGVDDDITSSGLEFLNNVIVTIVILLGFILLFRREIKRDMADMNTWIKHKKAWKLALLAFLFIPVSAIIFYLYVTLIAS